VIARRAEATVIRVGSWIPLSNLPIGDPAQLSTEAGDARRRLTDVVKATFPDLAASFPDEPI